MVDPQQFRRNIVKIVKQEYKVEFLGNNFDQIVSLLTPAKEEKIYEWISEVIEKNIQPIMIGTKKRYKEWTMNQLLTFRFQFSVSNTEYRVLFVKVKNEIYIEFHLGDHKYYDKVRKDLGLKKGGS